MYAVSGTRGRGVSFLRAQTLTLCGPGHQLSSVDLERIIGKNRDQDDAKNLWKGMGGRRTAEAIRLGEWGMVPRGERIICEQTQALFGDTGSVPVPTTSSGYWRAL